MPKCTVNGIEVEVKDGATVIEAFMKTNESIAHYCWHPGLSVAGVCRMCMVEIEGNPRLQIACNTPVQDGMVVYNNSEKVKEAVEWTLKFHLINHPLDCPICDQAGECGLQEYYMSHGSYDSEMAERKVKKHKVVDLGEKVVLDTERCILCSRCVRFTDEVTKTNELGIFNRGDRSEIGTFENRPLNNKYSLNTVDICPVGALTSKDFRFRQRVWFLKSFETICQGCSAGCNVQAYYNENGFYRVKPVPNEEVNGHWMCDEGRDVYKFANKEHRLVSGIKKEDSGLSHMAPGAAAVQLREDLSDTKKAALVLTGQYTTEEYLKFVDSFTKNYGNEVYHWINNPKTFDDFDGILLRGDKNPNTVGLLRVLEGKGIKSSWADLEEKLNSGQIEHLVVAGPENLAVFPDLEEKVTLFGQAQKLTVLTPVKSKFYESADYQIPMKSFMEKDGTFVNHKGIEQKLGRGPIVVSQALTLLDLSMILDGSDFISVNSASMGGSL